MVPARLFVTVGWVFGRKSHSDEVMMWECAFVLQGIWDGRRRDKVSAGNKQAHSEQQFVSS